MYAVVYVTACVTAHVAFGRAVLVVFCGAIRRAKPPHCTTLTGIPRCRRFYRYVNRATAYSCQLSLAMHESDPVAFLPASNRVEAGGGIRGNDLRLTVGNDARTDKNAARP